MSEWMDTKPLRHILLIGWHSTTFVYLFLYYIHKGLVYSFNSVCCIVIPSFVLMLKLYEMQPTGGISRWILHAFLLCSNHYLNTLLTCTIKYSRFTWYFPCSSPGIRHFFKETWFHLVDGGSWRLSSRHSLCFLLLKYTMTIPTPAPPLPFPASSNLFSWLFMLSLYTPNYP